MKKFVAIILCFMLLPFDLPFVKAQETAQAVEYKTVFEDDFTGTAETNVAGWTIPNNTNASFKYQQDPKDASNSVLSLGRTGGGDAELKRSLGNPITTPLVITFRAYACDETAGLRVGVRAASGGKANQIIKQLQFYKGQIMNGADVLNSDNLFDTEGWVNFKLEYLPAGTLNVWMNGKVIASNVETLVPDNGFETVILDIHKNKTGRFLVDDFCAKREYTAIEKAADAFSWENGGSATENINLPTTHTYEGVDYNIKWSSSNEDVISTNGTVAQGDIDEAVYLTATIYKGDDEASGIKRSFRLVVPKREDSLCKIAFSDDFTGTAGVADANWSYTNISTVNYTYAKDPENAEESVLLLNRTQKTDENGNAVNGDRVKLRKNITDGQNYCVKEDMIITFRMRNEDATAALQLYIRNFDIDGEGASLWDFKLQENQGVTAGQWHDIKLVIKNNGDSAICTTYLDGKQFGESREETFAVSNTNTDTGVVTPFTENQTGIWQIDFESRNSAAFYGKSYIDDFNVYFDYSSELSQASESLNFEKIGNGQQIDNVTGNLKLEDTFLYNEATYNVEWSTSNENVIKTDGTLIRRARDYDVRLVARISTTDDSAYRLKTFNVTVPGNEGNPLGVVFFDDFAGVEGEADSKWSYTNSGTAKYVYAKYPANTGESVLAFIREQSVKGTQIKMRKTITDGTNSCVRENMIITFRVRNEDPTASIQFNIRGFDTDSEGTILWGINFQQSVGFEAGKWYDVRIEIRNNGDTAICNAWATDGDNTITLYENSEKALTGVWQLDFESRYSAAFYGTSYVDDFCAYIDYSDKLDKAADIINVDAIVDTNASAGEITGNLSLPATVNDGDKTYAIEWESSDENSIRSDGTVERLNFETEVILTAKIYQNKEAGIYTTRQFAFNVLPIEGASATSKLQQYADLYIKEEAFTTEDKNSITKDLNLSVPEYDEIEVEWVSDNECITPSGIVTRPEYEEGNQQVTLTAKVKLAGEESVEKELYYTVLAYSDPNIIIAEAVEEIKAAYRERVFTDEDVNNITKNLTLPPVASNGATVNWTSSNSAVISNTGVVSEIAEMTEVTLTAHITHKTGTKQTVVCKYTVLPSDDVRLAADIAEIEIPTEATAAFDLPMQGEIYFSKYTWTSSNEERIVIYQAEGRAVVHRPLDADCEVTLTLQAENGDADTTETYTVTVTKQPSDTDLVTDAITLVDYKYINPNWEESGERVAEKNLSLPTMLESGVAVTWSTQDSPAVITTDGQVIRPLPGEGNKTATVTAVFTSNNYSSQPVTFTFTVPEFTDYDELMDRAKEELIFAKLSSQDIHCVTENLTLPNSWNYGTQISWDSSSDYLSVSGTTGIVTRPSWGVTSEPVTLTATITGYEKTRTSTFNLEILEENYMAEEIALWSEDFEEWAQGATNKTEGASYKFPAANEASFYLAQDPLNPANQVYAADRTANQDSTGYLIVSASKARGGIVYIGGKLYVATGGMVRFNGRTDDCDQVPVSINAETDSVSATGYTLPGAIVNKDGWNQLDLEIDVGNEMYYVTINGDKYGYDTTNDCAILLTQDTPENVSGIPFNYYGEGRTTAIKSIRMNFAKGKIAYLDNLYMDNKLLYSQEQLNMSREWEKLFLANNNIDALTKNLVLPDVWEDGVRVFYYPENTEVIDKAGMIQLQSGEADVMWKVGFSDGFAEYFKSYKLHVIKDAPTVLTDEEAATADLAAAVAVIKESGMLVSLTNNITIPAALGENGSTISVTGFNSALNSSGVITQTTTAQSVTLTVSATKNGCPAKTQTVSITVAAKAAPSTEESGGTTSTSPGGGGGGSKGPEIFYGESTKPQSGIEITQPDEEVVTGISFNDLADEHWAYNELMYMVKNGIMNGTGDGNIQPERTILREEFVKMLVLAMGLDLSDNNTGFTDVSGNEWFAPYIATAKENGLVNGYEDGSVGIGEEISRQDMAVMIFRAAQLAESGADDLFGDDEAISSYAKTSVYTLRDMGVINGKDNGNFAPKATATRAETACTLYRAIKKELFS